MKSIRLVAAALALLATLGTAGPALADTVQPICGATLAEGAGVILLRINARTHDEAGQAEAWSVCDRLDSRGDWADAGDGLMQDHDANSQHCGVVSSDDMYSVQVFVVRQVLASFQLADLVCAGL